MALSPMSSILLRPPFASPAPSPSPSPSPVSTPLPPLQADLSSSSSSSSASESFIDLRRRPSSPSTRRIRFAPLPEPDRDILFDAHDPPQPDTKLATQPVPPADHLHDSFTALSPTVSPDSVSSSVRSTPTIRSSPDTFSINCQKTRSKLLRPFSFFRRADSGSGRSSVSQPASLPSSRNTSFSSLPRPVSSLPNTPSFQSTKLSRISTEDLLSFGRKSLFRSRPTSSSSASLPRPSSPPPKRSDSSKPRLRSASTSSGLTIKPTLGNRDWGQGSARLNDSAVVTESGRRSSSSAMTPGAGGGRHPSVKMHPNVPLPRPSTAPTSPSVLPKKHVKMLNGRIYGAKRYAAQTLANPFANVREDPEFIEWGYGGMGSVDASAGIGSDVWKGLQRSERGGALLAGSADSPSALSKPATGAGGGRGSGARATSSIGRRKMSDDVPECGMGNVSTGGGTDDDDGSGMAWLKRRRAEREAKARLEQEAKEQEKRKSGGSFNASMYASTASTTTSLTACTSVASADLTTPTTPSLGSRSPSVVDLKLASSLCTESRDINTAQPCSVVGVQSSKLLTADPSPVPKDEHERHVLSAVRLSPSFTHKIQQAPPILADSETTGSANSTDEEPSRGSDEEEEQDDAEHGIQEVDRKTALGAGVEKISRHLDVKVR